MGFPVILDISAGACRVSRCGSHVLSQGRLCICAVSLLRGAPFDESAPKWCVGGAALSASQLQSGCSVRLQPVGSRLKLCLCGAVTLGCTSALPFLPSHSGFYGTLDDLGGTKAKQLNVSALIICHWSPGRRAFTHKYARLTAISPGRPAYTHKYASLDSEG